MPRTELTAGLYTAASIDKHSPSGKHRMVVPMKPSTTQASPRLFSRNFILLCLCNLCLGLTISLSLPVLPIYFTEGLGHSKSVAGAVVSIYSLAALFMRPFSGFIVDSFQRKPVLMSCLLTYLLFTSGYVFVTAILLLSVIRLFQGLAFGISGISINTLAVDNIPPQLTGTGIGFFGVTTALSTAIGPMCGMFLMAKLTYTQIFGVATVLGATACVLGFMVKSPRREIIRREGPQLKLENFFLKKGAYAALSLLLLVFAYGVVFNFTSLYARERGISVNPGMFYMFLASGLIFSRAFSGRLVDRGYLLQNIIAGKAFMFCSMLLFTFVKGTPGLFFSALCLGLSFGMVGPAYQTLLLRLASKGRTGTANSTYLVAIDAGIGIAALIGGVIADLTSLDTLALIGAGSILLSLALFLTRAVPSYRRHTSADFV